MHHKLTNTNSYTIELAEQAATGSYSAAQRIIMNSEFAEMAAEIERIAGATKFNNIAMLNTGTGTISIHVGTASTIDVDKVDMTQAGLSIETGDGQWSIMTNDDNAFDAATSIAMDVQTSGGAANNYVMHITFGSEEELVVTLAASGGAAGGGQFTLTEVRDLINAQSQNPSVEYDSSGNSLAYAAAEIIETNAGKFKLKLSARDTASTTLAITAEGAAVAAALTATNLFGSVSAGSLMALTDGFFQKELATGGWTSDSAGGAGAGLNILTEAAAITALATVTAAINTKDAARATFGYKMNRLESTIAILDIQAENLMAAESRVSDVDVATEMATLTRTQVLSQAGIAMLAQANSMPQMALTLLR